MSQVVPPLRTVPAPSPSRWDVVDAPRYLRGTLDQVAVGPGGVLALAHWPGDVVVRGGVARSGRGRQVRPVADVVVAAERLAEHLQEAHRRVTAALVVVPGDQRATWVSPGAIVLGARTLTSTLARLDTHLGPDDVSDVLRRLAAAGATDDDDLPTVATLNARLTEDRARRAGARRR